MAANSFNDTIVTAVRYAGLDENGEPNIYAQEAAGWMGVPVQQVFDVQQQYRTEDGFDITGLTAALKAMAPADVMQNVAQTVEATGAARDKEQKESAWDQGPLGGFGTALMGTALIASIGAAAGAFSGAAAGGGAADSALLSGADTLATGGTTGFETLAGVGGGSAAEGGIISSAVDAGAAETVAGTEGTTTLAGGAATDTVATTGGGLIESLGKNLFKAFEPWSLIKKAGINALSQAVMNDGKVDWSKVGVSTLLNAFGGALGQTAGTAVGAATNGLIGSIAGGAVSGVTQAAILGGKNMLATAIASGAASGIGSITQDWLKSHAGEIVDKIWSGAKLDATDRAGKITDVANAIRGGVRDLTQNIIAGNRDAKSIFTNALFATGLGYNQRDIDALWNDMEQGAKDALAKPMQALAGDAGQERLEGGGFGDFVGPPERFPDNALDQDPIPWTPTDNALDQDPIPGGQPDGYQDSAGRWFATEEEAQNSSNRIADEAGQTVTPTNVPYRDAEHPYEGNGRWWTTEEDAAAARDGVIVDSTGQDGIIGGVIKDNALDQDPIPGRQPPPDNVLDQDPIPVIDTAIRDNALDQDPIPVRDTTTLPEAKSTEKEPTGGRDSETGGGLVVTPIVMPTREDPPPPPPPPPPDETGGFGLSFSDVALGFNPIAGRTTDYWKTKRAA